MSGWWTNDSRNTPTTNRPSVSGDASSWWATSTNGTQQSATATSVRGPWIHDALPSTFAEGTARAPSASPRGDVPFAPGVLPMAFRRIIALAAFAILLTACGANPHVAQSGTRAEPPPVDPVSARALKKIPSCGSDWGVSGESLFRTPTEEEVKLAGDVGPLDGVARHLAMYKHLDALRQATDDAAARLSKDEQLDDSGMRTVAADAEGNRVVAGNPFGEARYPATGDDEEAAAAVFVVELDGGRPVLILYAMELVPGFWGVDTLETCRDSEVLLGAT